MRSIYLITALIIILYLLLKKRNINIISFYIISSIIYYSPSFLGSMDIGFLGSPSMKFSFNTITYTLLWINLTIPFFYILITEKKQVDFSQFSSISHSPFFLNISVITIIILFVAVNITYGSSLYASTYDKISLLEQSNRFVVYFKTLCMFSLVYVLVGNVKTTIFQKAIIFGSNVFIIFILAHRSFMAIAILSIIYHIAKYKKIRLVQHWKYLTLGFLLLVLVIALKSFIGPIKTGNYELLFDRITDFDHYISVLIQNESTIITFNLNSIIDHNFIYPPEDYLYNNLILPFLPFLKNIHEPNLFNFQDVLFPTVAFGMGSTYIGEIYASFGILGFIVFLNFLMGIFLTIENLLPKIRQLETYTFIIISLAYISFYIHRNTFGFTIISIKRILIIMVFFILCEKIIKIPYKKQQTQ